MSWQRKAGVSLIAAGAALCAVYLVPTVYGAAMSHLAVAQFRHQTATNALWDSSRIHAYQRTLSLHLAPPEAILRIPKVALEVPVLEGADDITLNRAVGHVPGSALPGQPGNIAITGHRDGFFRPLKDLAIGDTIDLDRNTASGPQTDLYKIRSIHIVFPSDTSVLNTTTASTLTLITCFPFYYVGAAPQRYIVQADLISAKPEAPSTTK